MAFGFLDSYSRFYRYVGPNTIVRKISETEVAFINLEPDYRESHIDQESEVQAAEPVSVPTYTVYGNTLNFAREDYITGINIIGQEDKKMLFWTDNRIVYRDDGTIERTNEPRKINIEKFKAASHVRNRDGIAETYAETNFPRQATYDPKFLDEEISVIKPHPRGPQNIDGDNLNRELQLNFDWVDITDYEYLQCQDDTEDTCRNSRQYTYGGVTPIDQDTCTGNNAEDDGCWCNPEDDDVVGCYSVITSSGEEEFNDANRIFQDAFPRFTYRWRYEDGEYSPIGPFTNVSFVPAATTINEIQRYSEGENSRMTNAVLGLTISNIPRGGTDVVAIDIIYKESITNTLYSIETIEIPPQFRGFGYETFNVNKRSFYRSLPANQLFRAFDEVPRAAKSQEISGNRLIYGNYLKNFEQPKEVNMTVVTLDRPNLTREGEDFVSSRQDQRSIKSDREYELGVVYIDKYGRQGGLLTGPQARYRTPFHFDSPQQFAAVISDDAPEWARYYRYYIKDVSAEHFNVFAHGIWRDPIEPEFTWVQISSADRNKVIEDGALYAKGYWSNLAAKANEHIHERSGDFQEIRTKYKREIIDISNDVPAVIRGKLNDAWNTNPNYVGPAEEGVAVEYKTCSTEGPIEDGGEVVGYCIKVGSSLFESDISYRKLPKTTDNPNYTGGAWNSQGWLPNLDGYYPDSAGNYPDQFGRYPIYVKEAVRDGQGNVISYTTETYYADENGEYPRNNLGNFADGSFFVKVPTGPVAPTVGEDNNLFRGDTELFEGWFGGDESGLRDYSYWFETEPQQDASLLDLYYESGETFVVEDDLKRINRLDWSNCVRMQGGSTGNIEERKLSGLFNSTELGNSVRANIPQENYELDRVFNGLIFSGLFNDGSGINRLNQFIVTDGITKEIEPNYGSIQKLYTRDTNLIVFLEDKIFRILTDKDALYNADGDSNVTSTSAVLGQATPYMGEYGISKNPESFCFYGQNIWFSDKNRGVMLQLTPSNGQIFEISSAGMNDFFRDRLKASERIIGAFDDYQDQVIVSLQNYDVNDVIDSESDQIPNDDGNQTVIYEHTNQGWVSRRSYIPDGATTLNNRFYSFKNGKIWVHNQSEVDPDTGDRTHTFYGEDYNASITAIFNDLPSSVKDFKNISYEGTTGWTLTQITQGTGDGNNPQTQTFPFVQREGKFFTPIVANTDKFETCDPANNDADPPTGSLIFSKTAGEDFLRLTSQTNTPVRDVFYHHREEFRDDVPQFYTYAGDWIYDDIGDDVAHIPLTAITIVGDGEIPDEIDSVSSIMFRTVCMKQDDVPYRIIEGGKQVSGTKGFWIKVTMEDLDTVNVEPLKELFSLGSEVFVSTK